MLKKHSKVDDLPRIKAEPAEVEEGREDLDFLLNEIIDRSIRIDSESGFHISVRKARSWLPLHDQTALQDWFDSLKTRSEQDLMRYFQRDIGLDLTEYSTFSRLLSSELVKDTEKLRRYVFLQAWNKAKGDLYEWVILLSLISGYGSSRGRYRGEVRLGPGTPPIPIMMGNNMQYLWFQKKLVAHRSQLDARPDFIITLNDREPSKDTILGLIECKATKNLPSKTIREVYGTAHDIGSAYAMIASYEPVPSHRVHGADELGVTIMPNPLRGLERKGYLEHKLDLSDTIKSEIERVDHERPLVEHDRRRRVWMDEKHSG